MRVRAEATAVVDCQPHELLALAMDPERYAPLDPKMGKVHAVRQEGGLTEVAFRPRTPGVGLPEGKVVAHLRLTPGRRVDLVLAPRPRNRLNHWMATYAASLACEPEGGRTRVTRVVSYDLRPAVGLVAGPVLRWGLPRAVREELRRVQEHFARSRAASA